MDKEEIYKGRALTPKSPGQTLIALLVLLLCCGVVFSLESYLPWAWIFELAAIIFSAVYANKILKQGTFTKTYILYEDLLVEVTRYGLIEKITAQFNLDETLITEKEIKVGEKIYPFYPDEALKKLLNL